MSPRSLRFWLTCGLSALVAAPISLTVAAIFLVLIPKLNAQLEAENRALANTVAIQVEESLHDSARELKHLSEYILSLQDKSEQLQVVADTYAASDVMVETLYILDPKQRVIQVGLPAEKRPLRENYIGLDLSSRTFIQAAQKTGEARWSDSYLSSGGKIVVAIAVPMHERMLLAEIDLQNFSEIVRRLGGVTDSLIVMLDRTGQVVAHPDAKKSLQQENWLNNPLVSAGLGGTSSTQHFYLGETEYIGTNANVRSLGWTIIAAKPTDSAFANQRSLGVLLLLGIVLSLVLSLIAALILARYLSRHIEHFIEQIQAMANGDYNLKIPRQSSSEMNNLALSIQRMATAVLERESKLLRSEAQYRDVVESSEDLIIQVDGKGRITFVNHMAKRYFGLPPQECIGLSLFDYIHSDDRAATQTAFYEWLNAKQNVSRFENRLQGCSGEVHMMHWSIVADRNEAGEIIAFRSTARDMTERMKAEEHIQFLAHHDPLTGLPNRTLLVDRLHQAMANSRRSEQLGAVLFLDLDRFKLINDTLGHEIGDLLLNCIANKLTSILRETETVARIGGDEFVIVVPEADGLSQLTLIAQKIMDAVAVPHTVLGHTLHVTPSLGISVFPDDGTDESTLLRNADTAMYHAKSKGRNNFQFFTQSLNDAVKERVALEQELRLALQRQEFLLYYQPQVDSRSGEVVGVEALLRWQHPERGLIGPGNFIPIAEETGLIIPIGEWVLREACAQTKRWHDAGHSKLRIGVNLSARQFQQANLYEQVARALEDTGLPNTALEIELTEGVLMENPETASDLLRSMADLGISLAIDDFGTGYSSLGYLKQFPVDRLKIDRSFVRDLAMDNDDAAIVQAVIAMAKSLRVNVIAEGVETLEQLSFLEAHGCYEVQGYYYARPQPAEELTSFYFTLPRVE